MTNRLGNLPLEIIYSIFAHLNYIELYKLCFVNKQFQFLIEHYIFQRIKANKEIISIKLSENNYIELAPTDFDYNNHIIEFKPTSSQSISLSNTSNQKWSAYHRLFQIHFSGWFNNVSQDEKIQRIIHQQKDDMFLHHYNYNSLIEKTYELPSWNEKSDVKDEHFIGDKGLILSMCYDKSDYYNQLKENQKSYYLNHCAAINNVLSPKLNVHWIRVTLDWVLSGLIKKSLQKQIYKESFEKLNSSLFKKGCFKYNPLSEPILDYIVQQQQQQHTTDEIPTQLITYIKSHTHECQTRLSILQRMLESSGIDSQILWKYTFAKSFVVGNGLLCEEDIVRRIQDSENEWLQKKKSIFRSTNSRIKV